MFLTMGRTRVFGFLAIILCLLVCLCAHAIVSVDEATKKVKAVQALTMSMLEKAQNKHRDAQGVKEAVESNKLKAEKAATGAETAAKGNEEALAFANKAKSELEKLLKIYSNAKDKAEKAADPLKELMLKARRLDGKAEIKILPNTGSSDDYSKVSESASAVKTEAEAFQKEINQPTPLLEDAKATLWTLSDHAGKAQLAKYQVDAIVTVAGIPTMLSEADIDIQTAEKNREDINRTVEEIRDLFKKTPQDLMQHINGLLNNAESELTRISRKIKNMQKAKEAMAEMKTHADDALAKVKNENDEVQARKEFQNVNFYSEKAAESLKNINTELRSTQSNVENATYRKRDVQKALSPNNGKPDAKEDTKTDKTEQPDKDSTTNPADKGGVPTFRGNNDNAVTVSFSLLLAFIACAVLR